MSCHLRVDQESLYLPTDTVSVVSCRDSQYMYSTVGLIPLTPQSRSRVSEVSVTLQARIYNSSYGCPVRKEFRGETKLLLHLDTRYGTFPKVHAQPPCAGASLLTRLPTVIPTYDVAIALPSRELALLTFQQPTAKGNRRRGTTGKAEKSGNDKGENVAAKPCTSEHASSSSCYSIFT